jgi:KOW motif
MTTALKPNSILGATVRVLNGPCAGRSGTITDVDRANDRSHAFYKIQFLPPVYCVSAGMISSVWRKMVDIEVIEERGR